MPTCAGVELFFAATRGVDNLLPVYIMKGMPGVHALSQKRCAALGWAEIGLKAQL